MKTRGKVPSAIVLCAPGRDTAMGAFTGFVPLKVVKGTLKIVKLNVSRSGRHWDELLMVSPDAQAEIALVDISNSGKHHCRLFRMVDGCIEEEVKPPRPYWGEPCPVCAEIIDIHEAREPFLEVVE